MVTGVVRLLTTVGLTKKFCHRRPKFEQVFTVVVAVTPPHVHVADTTPSSPPTRLCKNVRKYGRRPHHLTGHVPTTGGTQSNSVNTTTVSPRTPTVTLSLPPYHPTSHSMRVRSTSQGHPHVRECTATSSPPHQTGGSVTVSSPPHRHPVTPGRFTRPLDHVQPPPVNLERVPVHVRRPFSRWYSRGPIVGSTRRRRSDVVPPV